MKYLSILILSGLCGCSFLVKKFGGIRDPRIENYHAVNIYAASIGIDSSDLVFCRGLKSSASVLQTFRRSPEILIFDNLKKYHPYKPDSSSCNAPVDLVLANICQAADNSIQVKDVPDYDHMLDLLEDPNRCLSGFDLPDVDYIVFFNFSSHFEKINREHFIPWNRIIRTFPRNCRVKYVYISMDYLDTWGLSKKDIPKLKFRSKS